MNPRSADARPIVLAILIFATLSMAAGLSSKGFLEGDACTHYLQARFAFQHPQHFVNIWGRPLFTMLYALPASLGGRLGAQLMSLTLAIGCGLVAYEIARTQQYRWPVLALIFTLAQPLLFLHSFSEMTELPFALLIGTAFLAYLKRQWLVMAVLVSLSPLSRPEGFGFLTLGALALVLHRRAWWVLILPLPLLAWNYAGWMLSDRSEPAWRWLIDNWPYAAESVYERGSILRYVQYLPTIVSPIIFPCTCIGIWLSLRRWGGNSALIAIIPLLILVGHSILFAFGKLASNGELRYMLIVAPFWGLLSARGWEWTAQQLGANALYRLAGAAALLPILANISYPCVPLVLQKDDLAARSFVEWYGKSEFAKDYPRVATAHQMIHYYLGTIGTDPVRALDWKRDTLADPPAGTLAIWDPIYSVFNSDVRRKVPLEDLLRFGWIDVTAQVPQVAPGWHILLSPEKSGGRDAESPTSQHSPSSP